MKSLRFTWKGDRVEVAFDELDLPPGTTVNVSVIIRTPGRDGGSAQDLTEPVPTG